MIVYETRGPIVLLKLGTKYIRMRKTLHKLYCQKARNADSLPVKHCFHISLSASVYHKRNQRTTEKSYRKSDRIEVGYVLVYLVMMIHFGKDAACGFCLSEHRLSVAPWKATLTAGNHLANPNRSCKQNVGYQMNFKIKYIIFIARLAATKVFD